MLPVFDSTSVAPPSRAGIERPVTTPRHDPEALVMRDDGAAARQAIGAALAEAERDALRVAVCVGLVEAGTGGEIDAALGASIATRLRRGDSQHRVGDVVVVVGARLAHPADGDRLADRLRASSPEGRMAVGLAVHPVHGADAATLLAAAFASALRMRRDVDEASAAMTDRVVA